MSKYTTKKGLAFGAGIALVASGLGVAPATAAGMADTSFVSLSPSTGTEYTVLTDQYFDLKSNAASTIATSGNIKFLVEDTTAALLFDVDVNGGTADATTNLIVTNGVGTSIDDATVVTSSGSAATLTFTGGFAHGLAIGDALLLDDSDGSSTSAVAMVTGVSGQVVTTDLTTSGTPNNQSADDIKLLTSQSSTTAFKLHFAAAHTFLPGDTVTLAGFSNISTGTSGTDPLNRAQVVTTVTAKSISFTLANPAAATALDPDDVTAASTATRTSSTVLEAKAVISRQALGQLGLIGATPVVQTTAWASPSNGRKSATDGTFVVDTNVASASDDKGLRLISTSAESKTVNVTAWVDTNDNGAIDSTEYASPVRSVTFKKASELLYTTTFVPMVGDETVSATMATVPVLNGEQVEAQDASSVFGAKFTRQDSSATVTVADNASTWSNTTKLWTSTVSMDLATTGWTGLTEAVADGDVTEAGSSVVGAVTTLVSSANHNLRVGDKVTIAGTTDTDLSVEVTIANIVSATVFNFATPADVANDADPIAGTVTYTVTTFDGNDAITDRVFAGAYTVRPLVGATAMSTLTTAGVGAAVSASAKLTVVGTSTIQPGVFTAAADGNNVEVKKGTLSVPVSVSVLDSAGVSVGAGKNVTVLLGNPNEGTKAGTLTLDGAAVTTKVLVTDATGSVAFTVAENDGDIAAQTRVTVTAEGQSGAAVSVDLIWNDVTYKLYDLQQANTAYAADRTVNAGGSYVFELALIDQWKAAPAEGAYRLKVDNAGNTVSSSYHALSNGRYNLTVTDGKIGAGVLIDTDIMVQKLNTDGTTYADQTAISYVDAGLGDIAINVVASTHVDKVTLDIDDSTIYGNATADLSDAQAAKAVVAQDRRTSIATQPTYTNSVVVAGRVANATSTVVRPGAMVTVSGASNILFSEGGLDSFGSISVIADSAGEFSVELFSNTAQIDSVVTVTSNGASSTVKVTFTASAATAGTALAVTAPASVASGSTFTVTATLTDVYGNPVQVTDVNDILVSYTGPGIVFGTLPTVTNAKGQLSFAVLLGTNDKGTAAITVSYDQSSDGDFTGVLTGDIDLVSTVSVVVGAAAASDTKVNVGSFKGFVALYAKGYEGQKMSAIVAGKWIVVESLASDFERVVRFTGAGYTITTKIYIDGEQIGDAFTTVTK